MYSHEKYLLDTPEANEISNYSYVFMGNSKIVVYTFCWFAQEHKHTFFLQVFLVLSDINNLWHKLRLHNNGSDLVWNVQRIVNKYFKSYEEELEKKMAT